MSRTDECGPRAGSDERVALVARWYMLTRRVLPALAEAHRWPIRFDHCFMRVCLDEAFGSPWTSTVARPAVRAMSDDQLHRAIAVAERIAAEPSLLPALNEKSLAGRRAARAPSSPALAEACA